MVVDGFQLAQNKCHRVLKCKQSNSIRDKEFLDKTRRYKARFAGCSMIINQFKERTCCY